MKPKSSLFRGRVSRSLLPFVVLAVASGAPAYAQLYWDTNGDTPGSADLTAGNNIWGTNANWTADPTGSTATGAYIPNSDVIISAGTNSTGTSTIRIAGAQTANSLTFEEGTVTVSAVNAYPAVTDTLTIGAGGITLANGLNGAVTIGGSLGNIVLSASQSWTNNTVTDAAALPVATTARAFTVGNGLAGSMVSGSATTGNSHTLTITGPTTALVTAATTLNTILADGANGGTLNLAKTGSAQLTLSGTLANTYTGTTTVTAGILALNKTAGMAALSGNSILVNGGTLRHNAATADNQIVDTATITISSGSVTFSGADETLAAITLSGGGFSTGNTSGALSNVTLTGALTVGGNGKTTINSGATLSAETVNLTGTNSGLFEASGGNILIGGSGTGTTLTQLLIGSGGLNMSGQTIQINATTGTLPGSRIVLGGDFTTTGNGNNVIGYSTGTGGGASQVPVTPATLEIGSGTRNFTIAGSTLSTALGGATAATRIALQVTSVSGTGVLDKEGPGQLILTGANTYAGQTNVNSGILRIASNTALGTTAGGTVVAAGAGLQLEGGITVTGEALSLTGTSNTASVANVTAGLSNLTGNNVYAGPISADLTSGGNNNVRIASLAGNLEVSGPVSLIGGALDTTFTTSLVLTGSGNGSLTGNVSITAGADDLGLIKTGTGTWSVSGTNTYTGATRVDAGTMVVTSIPTNLGGAANATVIQLGDSTTTGTLSYIGTGETVTRGVNLNSTATGGGRIEQAAASGNLVISGNITSVNSSGAKTLTLLGSTAATGEVTGNITNSGNSTTALEKAGTGTWTLSGADKGYTGATSVTGGTLRVTAALNSSTSFTVTGGTLQLMADDRLRDLSNLTLGAGGVLQTDGNNERVNALIVTGNSTLSLTGSGSVINFGQSDGNSWTGILSITGWDGLDLGGGDDQVIFANSGLTPTQLGQINFVDPTGFAPGTYAAQFIAGGNEIVPGMLIPEPSAALLAALGALGLAARRRRPSPADA